MAAKTQRLSIFLQDGNAAEHRQLSCEAVGSQLTSASSPAVTGHTTEAILCVQNCDVQRAFAAFDPSSTGVISQRAVKVRTHWDASYSGGKLASSNCL